VDALVAVAAAALECANLWSYDRYPQAYGGLFREGFSPFTPAFLVAIVVLSLPLVWRQRAPLPVFATVAVLSAAAQAALGLPLGWWASLPAIYEVALRTDRTRSLVALAGLTALAALSLVIGFPGIGAWLPALLLVYPAEFCVPWLLGFGARRRRERERLLDERRRTEALRSLGDERARLARELHDLLADSISVMVTLASAGRRSLPADPDRAAGLLAEIETTGRAGMVEVRRLLSLLRGETVRAEVRPQQGLDALPDLLDRLRAAGLDAGVTVDGERRPLDPAVDLAAHRILEEALTNVLKHAGSRQAAVRIAYLPDRLGLEVRNIAGGPRWQAPGADQGGGLLGMRERALLLGGSLEAGPTADGGFVVSAALPLDDRLVRS
jgi:signal transduction histidine kinase